MMKYRFLAVILAGLSLISTTKAQEFFSTEDAPKFFTFGARIGFNTSNRTFPKGAFNLYTHNSWGTGFNIGVVAGLNFKDYLSIQPGIFFESRSGNFSYVTDYLTYYGKEDQYFTMGHIRAYYFTIPVTGVVKFNLAENIRWNVELGPYFQFKLKETGPDIEVPERLPQSQNYTSYIAQNKSFDVGLKLGTGLTFCNHYYLGVHYLAGFCNAWSHPSGGKNKSWSFTVGYDF